MNSEVEFQGSQIMRVFWHFYMGSSPHCWKMWEIQATIFRRLISTWV